MVSVQKLQCSDNNNRRHCYTPGLSMRKIRSNFHRTVSDDLELEPCSTNSPDNLRETVNNCIKSLSFPSFPVKRSATAMLRLLAKNRSENRALIGELGAVPALIPLLHCSDSLIQENSATALLNLSLLEENKTLITQLGAIKPLIHVLETGSETAKQNAACALLNLSLIGENNVLIELSCAIPPLIVLLANGSKRGKKDAITTLYKICLIDENKEKAVSSGAVKLLVDMVGDQGGEMAEKAMVVLCSLAGIETGKAKIVEEGGISALVEVIEEEGSIKGKEFAVMTLIELCHKSVKNRGLLVREGCIPPLIELSQCGTVKARQKAKILIKYLRESRQEEASSSSP